MPRILERPVPQVADTVLGGLPPLLRRLYLARGIRSEAELELGLAGLLRPQSMGGLPAAVELLAGALEQDRSIMVVGDYDADGATGTAVSVLALRALGGKRVDYLIPDRFTMGYGLSPEIVEQAAARGAELLLTVDAGIASLHGVARARALGMQVVVTDHHLPGEVLPEADAIVNPNLSGDLFPGKHTAGVGVAFYLMQALHTYLQESGGLERRSIHAPKLAELLDLVALGTVADLVRLDQNNRILVEQGLLRIRAGRCRPGITALLQVASRPPERATATDLAFSVGPRLNAAGRLEDMRLGVECLLCDDPSRAWEWAGVLDGLNRERRQIETGMKEQAELMLEEIALGGAQLPLGICLYDERWHQGVIGILASRLKDRYNRPAIALAPGEGDTVKGSARSIPDLHMRDLLACVDSRHPGLLARYGGHAMAAGLTLQRDGVERFTRAFADEVHRQLDGQPPQVEILSDGPLAAAELNTETARLLRYAGPWGQGFPAPLFDGEFQLQSQCLVGGIHLKMVLSAEGRSGMGAIAFRWGDQLLDATRVRAVYRLDLNEYRGKETPQLIVEHLEPA